MPADTVTVARDVLSHLNSWEDKPCKFALEELPNKAPSLMLQPLAGSGILRRYVDGSFIGLFSFAVYYRTDMADTSEKLTAYEVLENLAYWLENSDLPELSGNRTSLQIEQTATPAIASINDDMQDYQTIFELRYKQKT